MSLDEQLRHRYRSEPITLDELTLRLDAGTGAGWVVVDAFDDDELTLVDGAAWAEPDLVALSPRSGGGRRSHRRLVVAVAAAVCVIGIMASTRVWRGADNATSTVAPGATARWVPIPQGDAFEPEVPSEPDVLVRASERNAVYVTRIESTTLGYFAIGAESREGVSVGAVWRSDDGKSWARVGDPDGAWGRFAEQPEGRSGLLSASMWSIAEHDGIVVIGGDYRSRDLAATSSAGAVWSTTDGVTWTSSLLPSDSDGSIVQAIVGTDDGFLAFVSEYGARAAEPPSMWQSQDGVVWQPIDASGLTRGTVITAMAPLGSGPDQRIVAVGSDGTLSPVPAAWYSDDRGNTWTRASVDNPSDWIRPAESRGMLFDQRYGRLVDLRPGPDGLVAVGDRTSAAATATPSRAVVTWHSDDGVDWTERIVDAVDGREWNLPQLAVGPEGFVVTAYAAGGDENEGASWISRDGIGTTRLEHPLGRTGGTPTAVDDGYVIVTLSLADVDDPSFVPPAADPPEVWALDDPHG